MEDLKMGYTIEDSFTEIDVNGNEIKFCDFGDGEYYLTTAGYQRLNYNNYDQKKDNRLITKEYTSQKKKSEGKASFYFEVICCCGNNSAILEPEEKSYKGKLGFQMPESDTFTTITKEDKYNYVFDQHRMRCHACNKVYDVVQCFDIDQVFYWSVQKRKQISFRVKKKGE